MIFFERHKAVQCYNINLRVNSIQIGIMSISEKLEELYLNILMELIELPSFKNSTLIGYDLIEKQYSEHMKVIEAQISDTKEKPKKSSLEMIRLKLNASKKGIHSLGNSKDAYINRINKSIVIYACSIFDFFLTETIRLTILEKPNLLSSEKKTIPFYELLINSKEEIIESVIDKYIHEFSYKSVSDRIKYMSDKFELDITFQNHTKIDTFFSTEINLDDVIEIFAIRNIVIHNQGKVNKIFLDSVRNTKYKLNDNVIVDDDLIVSLINSLMITASSISRQLIMRYH